MTRVLMFGWELPPHNSGGLGVASYALASALTAEGLEVTFVLPSNRPYNQGPFRVVFAQGGELNFNDSFAWRGYLTAAEYERLSPEEKAAFGQTLYAAVLKFGESGGNMAIFEGFDVIHAHDWLSFAAGIKAKRLSGKPLVAHVHLTSYEQAGGQPHDERQCDRQQ